MSDRLPAPGSDQNRRDFFKSAAAASLGSAALLSPSLAARAYASGGDEIKVALVGCGARGAGATAQALASGANVKLWAMADAFPDRLEGCLGALNAGAAGDYNLGKGKGFGQTIEVPSERRFVGLDAYRRAIDAGADVVLIAGPPAFRPQHFEYAVAAGKHVFMENRSQPTPRASAGYLLRRKWRSKRISRSLSACSAITIRPTRKRSAGFTQASWAGS